MKKIITIDLDNVLAKTTEAFLEYYAKHYGKEIDINEIKYAYFNDNEQFDAIDTLEEWRRVYRYFMWNTNFEVIPGAREGVKVLHERWYILHILTWRNQDQEVLTYTWVEENFPGIFEDIHFSHAKTEKEVSKWELCKSLWAILHIDDFLDFSTSVAEQWILVYLFDRPRNQDNTIHPLITRIAWWEEVVSTIEK